MFASLPNSPSRLRNYRVIAPSVALHLAVLAAIIFHRPTVIVLAPTRLAYGDGSHSYRVTYFPPGADDRSTEAKLILPRDPSTQRKQTRSSATKPLANDEQVPINAEASDRNTRAGSQLGTMIDGPISGHEVHVAYPIVFPDPPVARSQLPSDVNGDVVIEVTIDAAGNVVETRVVQSIGHGIDEKLAATLRQWHYQPATLDGVPVASKHDVHFHFPS
jgi:TonB family protein